MHKKFLCTMSILTMMGACWVCSSAGAIPMDDLGTPGHHLSITGPGITGSAWDPAGAENFVGGGGVISLSIPTSNCPGLENAIQGGNISATPGGGALIEASDGQTVSF